MYGLKEVIKDLIRKNISEIESSSRLSRYGFALSLIHLFTFCFWFFHGQVYNLIDADTPAICHPFFQNCTAFRLGTPDLWRWILVFYLVLGLVGCWVWLKAPVRWSYTLTWLLLIFKSLIYLQDYRLMGNYHYIHFIFVILFLLVPRKQQLFPAAIVLIYLGAGVLKLNREWISGSALYGDIGPLKFIPIQLATVYVIFLELAVSWFLLSQNKKWQQVALVQFCIFHLYSIQIVGLFYPSVMFCILSIVFLKPDVATGKAPDKFQWRALWDFKPHLVLILFFLIAQLYPLLVPGNAALTGEGRLLSLNMFDARAQCHHAFLIQHNGRFFEQRNFDVDNIGTRIRCEPYIYLEMARRICEDKSLTFQRLDLILDTKLSSEEEYHTTVNQKDLCQQNLKFNPLWRNPWIQIKDPAASRWKTWHFQDADLGDGKAIAQYRNSPQRTGVTVTDAFLHPLSRPFWRKFNWNDNRHTASKSSPASDGNSIYVGSDQGVFASFKMDGTENWKWQVSALRGIHDTAAVIGNAVVWGDYDGILYSAAKSTGALNWMIDLGDAIGSSPLFSEGSLFVAVETATPLDGYVIRLNAVTGSVLWQSEMLGEQAHSSPALSEDGSLVYVGSNNGNLNALDVKTGKIVWRFHTDGPIKSTPMVAKNSVFFCSWDSHFYRVDSSTGTLQWNTPLTGRCQSSSAWSSLSNQVFISDSSGSTYCFDISNGTVNWVHRGLGNFMGSPIVIVRSQDRQEQLLGQCFTQALCLFDPKNGKILRKIFLGDRISSVPWIQGGEMIYTLDGPGGIVKWK